MNATDPVVVDLGDGKPRELRFTLKAVREAKKTFGSIQQMFASDVTDYLPELVYSGLVDKEGISPEVIADLIEWRNFEGVIDATMTAFTGKSGEQRKAEAAKNAQTPVQ